ncbi:hypothetical protein GCM10009625_11760 [Brachybacterium fresconis]
MGPSPGAAGSDELRGASESDQASCSLEVASCDQASCTGALPRSGRENEGREGDGAEADVEELAWSVSSWPAAPCADAAAGVPSAASG